MFAFEVPPKKWTCHAFVELPMKVVDDQKRSCSQCSCRWAAGVYRISGVAGRMLDRARAVAEGSEVLVNPGADPHQDLGGEVGRARAGRWSPTLQGPKGEFYGHRTASIEDPQGNLRTIHAIIENAADEELIARAATIVSRRN